ncbi:hypothetical protein AKG60_03060 [Vibrio parahaemolyticus]|uniref:Uncharacterized protein n=1 Tax=Vibrio parahaemolyticus TaxID=670 RepID=A0AAX0MGN6_VIBPH|nr:hypothetical protein [Vibrio vulnificus]EGQ8301969.1 hypothetical protein [Vibrio parahaemolyticus]MCS0331104.1 hypothetical protein [Vibrio diabolicus]ARN69194.1 hypothetical protein FORC36_4677 [Vibrio vulnificus]EGQ8891985.1 hypothetical protein [Vibrio parahaemolyticus]EJG0024059.1 hypothetical protein [Vibrio parahaemolyticus]
MKKIIDHLIDVMREHNADSVDIGELDILGEAYARYGGKIEHPLDRNKAVMSAVRRSDKFFLSGYLSAHDSIGRPSELALFRLKKEE